MTLAVTATKLGVSFYHYIHDRVSGAYQMPALADLIEERAKDLRSIYQHLYMVVIGP